ncbi:MAG: alpha/beta fold hydrolase, partial [Planctomycetota bacterium]|nr:alpha/beta fold hydrolase [Planctomycetota bacterium]
LLEQNTTHGKINELVVGSSEQLVKNGNISAARLYTMPDGVKIDSWIYKAEEKTAPRGTILVLHGLGDSKVTYMSMAKMLVKKGFDVVLTDLRAHGRSTGKMVTFGALEKQDQKRVIDELYKEKAVSEPLYVFGFDLGGSVAIQYAAIDPRVKGVMAMAPYRDIQTVGRKFLPLLSDEEFQKVIVRAGEIGKFDPADTSALKAITTLRCPVLLVHGKFDMTVPHAHSEALLAAAGGPKELDSQPLLNHISIHFGRWGDIVKGIEKLASGQVGKTNE